MPSSWTDSSDRQLLLSIIHGSSVATPKWDRIAEMMGEGYTASALRQRFQKLKNMAKAELGEGEKGTPRAKANGVARATPKQAAAKRKAKADESERAAEGDDDEGSAKKKVKTEEEDEEEFWRS